MRKIILGTFLVLCFFFIYAQDKPFDIDAQNEPQPTTIIVEKGQTLLDFMDPSFLSDQQTDINPGNDPEGDFMLRSTFTKDGSKVGAGYGQGDKQEKGAGNSNGSRGNEQLKKLN